MVEAEHLVDSAPLFGSSITSSSSNSYFVQKSNYTARMCTIYFYCVEGTESNAN